MKILLVGVGGVGEAIAITARQRPWLKQLVLADYNLKRARAVWRKLGSPKHYKVEQIDASDKRAIVALAKKHDVDFIVNAVDPVFNETIFDAAYQYGGHYLDLAMTLSHPHPKDPFHKTGIKLGDYQFERAEKWAKRQQLALVGMGVDPGLSDIFARYAEKHLFDSIDEIGVRDGSNMIVRGYAFAPTFSIWTTIEECLNPPLIWEKDKGWFTTAPFSEPETFDFPEGIGPVECVNIEHEEVLLIPRYIKCNRVTFKYGLGNDFIGVLQTLQRLGLHRTDPVNVKGVTVAPRDVVAACLPNPATLGDRMEGKTCVGTWVKGLKNGQPRQVYIYQSTDNAHTMKHYQSQAVVWQTGVNPVIALDLLASGAWHGAGVLGPEAFDPDPYLALMPAYDFPYNIKEM